MKHIFLFIFLLIGIKSSAQVYGNAVVPDVGYYNANQIVWLKVITGPTDSGFFTHYGVYDHPTLGGTCELKLSIYSQHATFANRPAELLADDFLAAPVNGVWNEHPVGPQVAIEPNTTYWIGLRANCQYGTGREAGVIWANQPLRYYDSWSFFSSWPDPVGSSPSSWFSVQNVGLYLIGNNMTLPVELISFDAENKNDNVVLDWKVASEINNEGWNVQRSENGFTWNTIGHVEGGGNEASEKDYSYIDKEAPSAIVFYRLEQVDFDGQTAYSEVKSIDMYKSQISVYPSTTSDYVTVDGIEEAAEYKVYSNQQIILQQGKIRRGEQIDLTAIAQGIYYVMINKETFKIVKI